MLSKLSVLLLVTNTDTDMAIQSQDASTTPGKADFGRMVYRRCPEGYSVGS